MARPAEECSKPLFRPGRARERKPSEGAAACTGMAQTMPAEADSRSQQIQAATRRMHNSLRGAGRDTKFKPLVLGEIHAADDTSC
jgi:hypothetical protein